MPKKLTVENVVRAIRALPSRRNNPRVTIYGDMPSCAYTHPKTGKHCIAGQVLSDLGYKLPAVDSENNAMPISVILSGFKDVPVEVNSILTLVQDAADKQTIEYPTSRNAWSRGKEAMEEHLLDESIVVS